jgi:ribosomal protein S18 acetylase RimI-like enzyme
VDHKPRKIERTLGVLLYRYAPGLCCEVIDINVSNSIKRKGTGRDMVNELVYKCRADGIKLVYAISRETNTMAHAFWKGIGFTEIGELLNFYWDEGKPQKAYVFGRRL